MDSFGKGFLMVVSAIITLAIVAVILSKKSDSAGLVQSLGSTLSGVISSAVTPLPAAKSSNTGALGLPKIPSTPDFLDGLFNFPLF